MIKSKLFQIYFTIFFISKSSLNTVDKNANKNLIAQNQNFNSQLSSKLQQSQNFNSGYTSNNQKDLSGKESQTNHHDKKKYLIVAPLGEPSFNSSLKSKKDIIRFIKRQLSLKSDERNHDQISDKMKVEKNQDKYDDEDSISVENSVVSLQEEEENQLNNEHEMEFQNSFNGKQSDFRLDSQKFQSLESQREWKVEEDEYSFRSKELKKRMMPGLNNINTGSQVRFMYHQQLKPKSNHTPVNQHHQKQQRFSPKHKKLSKDNLVDQGTLSRRSKFVSQQSAPLPAKDFVSSNILITQVKDHFDSGKNIHTQMNDQSTKKLLQNQKYKLGGKFNHKAFRRAATIKLEDISEDLASIKESQSENAEDELLQGGQGMQGMQRTAAKQRWSDIVSEIRRFPVRTGEALERIKEKKKQKYEFGFGNDSFERMRKEHKFFNAISLQVSHLKEQCYLRGGEESLKRIQLYLDNDPKKHMYEHDNPNHTINKPNTFGLRPLYLACLNGHLDVVSLLIENGANLLLGSIVNLDTHKEESSLVVAARWNHAQVVNYLLEKFEWPQSIVKESLLEAQKSSQVWKCLSGYIRKKYGACNPFCCIINF
eukprot:403333804